MNASKESVNLIVEYLINLVKRDKNLKEKLEYKKMLRYPINVKLLLINLIMSIWGKLYGLLFVYVKMWRW